MLVSAGASAFSAALFHLGRRQVHIVASGLAPVQSVAAGVEAGSPASSMRVVAPEPSARLANFAVRKGGHSLHPNSGAVLLRSSQCPVPAYQLSITEKAQVSASRRRGWLPTGNSTTDAARASAYHAAALRRRPYVAVDRDGLAVFVDAATAGGVGSESSRSSASIAAVLARMRAALAESGAAAGGPPLQLASTESLLDQARRLAVGPLEGSNAHKPGEGEIGGSGGNSMLPAYSLSRSPPFSKSTPHAVYDPMHKLYHHFWQAHLSTPPGGGPDIGHAVSADLVHWAHLPVAVWNDQPYDNVAIYTGSATIVNGVPTMVYPGLCNKADWPACGTGTLLAVAVPDDHTGDALLTNWSKPAYNPIVEDTQRDPSTAWQTKAGEWRLTNYEGKVFRSDDFITWSRAADAATPFPVAECPDFFPVPAACTGNGCDEPPAPGFAPTHVHKHSSGGDWYAFGVYADGAPNTSGSWSPYAAPGLTPDARGQPLDASQLLTNLGGMQFYASKSFFDPASGGGRRVYWGWALVPPASAQTLPRVTTYHAGLQRLIFQPLPELVALRGAELFVAASVPLAANSSADLSSGWSAGAGNASELAVSFVLPAAAATFGIRVSGVRGGAAAGAADVLAIAFDPTSFTARVSWAPASAPAPANASVGDSCGA